LHAADRLLKTELLETIRALEESLWRSKTRFSRELMDKTFAEDFFEFGRSGRRYGRDEMFFDKSAPEDINATLPLPEFHARHITDDVVQVTYVSEVVYDGTILKGNRSSIWSRTEGTWQLRFHQGTPIPDKKQNEIL
jgi:hypothetical protein